MKFHQAIYILTLWLLSYPLQSQVLDEETGFIYVKAEYLFETLNPVRSLIDWPTLTLNFICDA